jgi:hypothetical protein
MTSNGLPQTAFDGPETLYNHFVAPTLVLGSAYQSLYLQQRQQLIRMEQELNHLYEVMDKAGLGTPSTCITDVYFAPKLPRFLNKQMSNRHQT